MVQAVFLALSVGLVVFAAGLEILRRPVGVAFLAVWAALSAATALLRGQPVPDASPYARRGVPAARPPHRGLLLSGGPAELVRRYRLGHEWGYGDACHLCNEARPALRRRFAESLAPDPMYGVVES